MTVPRIAIVHRSSLPSLGGVEIHIDRLAAALVGLGYKPVVITRQVALDSAASRTQYRYAVPIWSLPRVLKREAPTLVHAHAARSLYALVALAVARWMRIPALFTPHCFYPSRSGIRRVLKWFFDQSLGCITFRLATRVIALTEVDYADALRLGCPSHKLVLVPNAIDTEMLDTTVPVTPRYPLPFLLFVGRVDRIKRLPDLVEALARLPETNLNLLVVGIDAGGRHAAEKRATELGVTSRMHFIGNISLGELVGLYRAAAGLVLPSAKEGLPTCVLEAMYLGCPVIASGAGGTQTVIRSGVNGLLYTSGDICGLVEAIRRLMSSPHRSMCEEARRTVLAHYTWSRTARQIASLVQQLD